MYSIDELPPLDFILDAEVLQICIGPYDVILKLSKGVEISIECHLRLVSENGTEFDVSPSEAARSSGLYRLLNHTIESYKASSPTLLVIEFHGGAHLKLVVKDEGVEAFRISGDGRDYVV